MKTIITLNVSFLNYYRCVHVRVVFGVCASSSK